MAWTPDFHDSKTIKHLTLSVRFENQNMLKLWIVSGYLCLIA
jgi:hypothetical protein